MTTFGPVPPGVLPLAAGTIGLIGLYIGRRILCTRTIPPLLWPLLRLNGQLFAALQGEAAPPPAPRSLPAETVRVYGWAFVYAGTVGLVVAAVEVARLVGGLVAS